MKKNSLPVVFSAVFFLGEFFFLMFEKLLSQFLGFAIEGMRYAYNVWDTLVDPASAGLVYAVSAYILIRLFLPLLKGAASFSREKQIIFAIAFFAGIKTIFYITPWFAYQIKDIINPLLACAIGLLFSIPAIYIAYLLLKLAFNFYRYAEAHLLALTVTLPLLIIGGCTAHLRFLGGFFSKESLLATGILAAGFAALYAAILFLYAMVSKISRKARLILSVLIIIILANCASYFVYNKLVLPKSTATDKPNIFIFVLDAMRYDHLSCNGYPEKITPNIDSLSTRGYRYTNFYSSATWSLPSYVSMFTGLYPSYHRMQFDYGKIGDTIEFETLAETLRKNGYLTAIFTNNPFLSREFDTIKGFDYFNEDWITTELIFSSHFLEVRRIEMLNDSFLRKFGIKLLSFLKQYHRGLYKKVIGITQKLTVNNNRHYRLSRKAERWIFKNRNRGMPLFVFICQWMPHAPYIAPALYANKFAYGQFETNQDVTDYFYVDPYYKGSQRPKIYNEEKWKKVYNDMVTEMDAHDKPTIAMYKANVSYSDYLAGDFYEYLEKTVDTNNSIFLLLSDHGEEFMDHKTASRFNHTSMPYNSVIKTPLIAVFPKKLEMGGVITRKTQNVDLTPSILKLAGIEHDRSAYQGLDTLFDKEPQMKEDGRVIAVEFTSAPPSNGIQVIIDGDYKYIRFRNIKPYRSELYNLKEDPEEHNDIFENHRDIAAALDKKLEDFLKQYSRKKDFANSKDEKTQDLMRSLGYLQ